MTVEELIEALDDFGGHLPVIVNEDRGDTSKEWTDISVDYGCDENGDPAVVIAV